MQLYTHTLITLDICMYVYASAVGRNASDEAAVEVEDYGRWVLIGYGMQLTVNMELVPRMWLV